MEDLVLKKVEYPLKTEPVGLTCSFCGKIDKEVRVMISGPGVYICDDCVRFCCEILLLQGLSIAEEISE